MSDRSSHPASTRRRVAFADDDQRYEALRRRDPLAEGAFFHAVETTGIYCRPTCGARTPLRKNVRFFATAAEAERAGFRPCKRCRPRELPSRDRGAAIVASARRRLGEADAPVDLSALAESVGTSPSHLRRLFRDHTGMTPREYAAAQRLARADRRLREGATVTEAIHEAGYSSSSRFYEKEGATLGMSPSSLRRGGLGVSMRAVVAKCSLGLVLVAATARGVCAIAFGEARAKLFDELRQRFPRAAIEPPDRAVEALARRVVAMIDEARVPRTLPLDLIGTAFQQRVWRALREIPRGETSTYAEVARRIGSPRAPRAVGAACGKNPVAVAVPCHRVVRDDGSLGGYRWGLARKKKLLARERD